MIIKNAPLLTAIIPTNNLSGLRINLENILTAASRYSIETILVVDQDLSSEIESDIEYLENLELAGSRIIVTDKRSPGGARNDGLARVQTPWVAFWDSDDEPEVGAFQRMVSIAASSNEYNVAVGNYLSVGPDKNTSQLFGTTKDDFAYSVAKRPGLWRFAFKVSRISNLKFNKSMLGEDQLFLALLNLDESEIFFSNLIVYRYFSGNPQSLTTSRKHINDLSIVYHDLINARDSGTAITYTSLMSARISLTLLKSVLTSSNFPKLSSIVNQPALRISSLAKSILQLFTARALTIKNGSPKSVTVHLAGGLGNQLFQLAAGLRIAKNRSVIIEPALAFPRRNLLGNVEISDFILPVEVSIDVERKYRFILHKLTNLVIRLSGNRYSSLVLNHFVPIKVIENALLRKYLNRDANIVISGGLGFSEISDKEYDSPYLIGLFQSYKWLEDHETRMKMQSLRLVDESVEFKVLRDTALLEKPMVVHIRLGDYKAESDFGILSGDYYREAVGRLIGTAKTIWVFTNEEELAKKIFPAEYSENVRWVTQTGLSSSQTLELMRYGSSFVIGNSTFSWWSAILNYSGTTQVVAPSPWFKSTESPRDLIPKAWIQVEASFLKESS